MIEGHGNDIYDYVGMVKADFSSNIAFNSHSEEILEMLKAHLRSISNYPDPKARILSERIAQHHGVEAENVLVMNGSAEAFYVIAHLLSERNPKSLIFTPSFAEYEDSCRVYKHRIDYLPIENYESVDYSAYHSAWIGSPNNPNGYRVPMEKIKSLAKLFPQCSFIIDRAYNDLSASCEPCVIDDLPQNIILIYSLTKMFGVPGVRLGYVVADAGLIQQMKCLRAPWMVNALSQVVGEYVMEHYERLLINRKELLTESLYLQNQLGEVKGVRVLPSDCNFFLCELCNDCTTFELQAYLMNEQGILIRNASNFRGLTEKHFRLAAQKREDNDLLIHTLKEWNTIF